MAALKWAFMCYGFDVDVTSKLSCGGCAFIFMFQRQFVLPCWSSRQVESVSDVQI